MPCHSMVYVFATQMHKHSFKPYERNGDESRKLESSHYDAAATKESSDLMETYRNSVESAVGLRRHRLSPVNDLPQ